MSGPLPRRDADKLVLLLESLRLDLERLYWQASKRDALEGQRLRLFIGPYKLHFKMDNEVEWGLVKWGLKRPTSEEDRRHGVPEAPRRGGPPGDGA